jgi:thioredoxin reductase (NADPH)
MTLYDVICIGAGPTGLACAIEAKRAGLRSLVIDKGCLCNSLYHYPTNMVFFTTPERMEIGDLPMTTLGGKPTRAEALKYYRRAVEHYNIEVKLYERVDKVEAFSDHFLVQTQTIDEDGSRDGNHSCASPQPHEYQSRKVIIATGYYDLPNYLAVPGEDLPCVSHYFTDPHPYWNQNVVVIGAKNSAAEAALELFRGGARVTLVHRGAEVGKSLKYWVKPDIENRIRAGEIKALFNHRVTRFEPGRVHVQTSNSDGDRLAGSSTQEGASGSEKVLPATHAFVMTGYHPDFSFLQQQGIRLDPVTMRPQVNPETLETNVPGIFVAGVVVGGRNTSDIFIENGRFHGRQIVAAMTGRGRIQEAAPVAPPGE